jgi:hypothetical protein
MSLPLSDLEQMNKAWADWYLKRAPRNEEAFYTCFKEAWEMSAKYYDKRINLLEQEVAWVENGYTRKDDDNCKES